MGLRTGRNPNLTRRQIDVVRQLTLHPDQPLKMVAGLLGIETSTLEVHIKMIGRKLHASFRSEIMLYAVACGLVKFEEIKTGWMEDLLSYQSLQSQPESHPHYQKPQQMFLKIPLTI